MTAATTAPRDPGPVPELAWLPVDKIVVDHTYQRAISSRRSQALIERIGADFKWAAFQAILACVTADGGGWLVLDGQHRVEGARRAGISHVPAVVVAAGSVAEQALAFVRANLDRVALNQYALFHARIAAEDEQAIATARVCAAAGIEIPRYPIPLANLKPGQTLALGGVSRMVLERGEEFATAFLSMIATACSGTRGQIKASLLRACSRIVEGELSRIERLSRVLTASPIEKFFAFCFSRRQREGTGEAQSIEDELRGRMSRLAASEPAQRESTKTDMGIPVTEQKQQLAPAAPARKPVAAPKPAEAPGSRSAAREEELRKMREFETSKGVGRVAGEVKTVATYEQAIAALKDDLKVKVKVVNCGTHFLVHGQKVNSSQLVELTNRLLTQRQIVRVKPGERVSA